jgi:hypothetical protein
MCSRRQVHEAEQEAIREMVALRREGKPSGSTVQGYWKKPRATRQDN